MSVKLVLNNVGYSVTGRNFRLHCYLFWASSCEYELQIFLLKFVFVLCVGNHGKSR